MLRDMKINKLHMTVEYLKSLWGRMNQVANADLFLIRARIARMFYIL